MGHDTPESAAFELRLFGAFAAWRQGQTVEGLHKRKGERLLAYLTLRMGDWIDTHKVAADLWSGSLTDDPGANLRQTLTYVRQLLGQEAGCIESRVGAIRIMLRTEQADILRFAAICKRADGKSISAAKSIAEEPLLAGWNDPWIQPFRERYARRLEAATAALWAGDAVTALPKHAVTGRGGPPTLPHLAPGEGSSGGVLALDSPVYILRSADRLLRSAIDARESIVLLKGAQQSGKSSLMARGMQHARESGSAVFHSDCEQFAPDVLGDRDGFYIRLLASLAEQTDTEFHVEADWKSHLGANGSLERFLRRRVLPTTPGPIVWALDGIDLLFRTGFYNEFFALLRGLHSRRATEPDLPWHRLTVILAAATEAHLYIRDLSQSPFNVGARIAIHDFDESERAELFRRYGRQDDSEAERDRIYKLLGGHPYLLSRGLKEMRDRRMSAREFTEFALRYDGPFRDHLKKVVNLVLADPELVDALRSVLTAHKCNETCFFRLRTAGVIAGEFPSDARPRCGLYTHSFEREILS